MIEKKEQDARSNMIQKRETLCVLLASRIEKKLLVPQTQRARKKLWEPGLACRRRREPIPSLRQAQSMNAKNTM